MTLKPINIDISSYPPELQPLLTSSDIYDSSCSPDAKVIFIQKDGGYFLKTAPKGKLESEAVMTRYFHGKGLSANVLAYISNESDYMLTEKIRGDDCTTAKYLENPKRLCDTIAERLLLLHAMDFSDCPVQNRTRRYIASAEKNKQAGIVNMKNLAGSGYNTPEEAWRVVETKGHLLQDDTLLHGDYCLPNIILDDWHFSGFIDFDEGGVGDRHIDIFWGAWTLLFNLDTDKYRARFFDAYGRDKIDEERLKIISAIAVFG